MNTWPGEPYPLGARWDGHGVNFALFSENATAVELCLFSAEDGEEQIACVPVVERTDQVWHVYLPDAAPGLRYGYRVHGPWEPKRGHRFNPHKLVLDPYATAVSRDLTWGEALFGYRIGPREDADLVMDTRDSASLMPKGVVVDGAFDWADDVRPKTPWHETVIYELHVKGFTMRHPEVPPELRGTYAGLATEPVLRHLQDLGVTAVELMPIHQFVSDQHLLERGLSNYWGYNTLGYFAPHLGYASSPDPLAAVRELKSTVRSLHKANIEVILDVVYNHTAEGNHLGPTLSFRGIDNASYYRLVRENPRYYMDYSGCGNTLNMRLPRTLQMLMDSLRYWVLEMHVDGFRFDLASALARGLHAVDRLAAFFETIHQDPVLSQVKLIAEPWDIGDDGYLVGGFPPGWAEWNGRYRDTVRDYWRGEDQTLADVAYRFTGSSDLYESSGRRPYASINFVTAHDGFTLKDLVSYNEKHNEENGEKNKDGADDNRSWNCGVEGPAKDPGIDELRRRQIRNFLATLFLSQGVPMLSHGDELGRTQRGNNNAYCQDNPLSWVDWENLDEDLLAFTKRLIHFRAAHPVFRRRRWFQGRPIHGAEVHDVAWFTPEGERMSEADWQVGFAKALGVFLSGEAIATPGPRGEQILDDTFYVLFNAHHGPLSFTMLDEEWGQRWTALIDTEDETVGISNLRAIDAGQDFQVQGRSLVVLRRVD